MMLRKTRRQDPVILATSGASMRPQHDAAENDRIAELKPLEWIASMRPQHDAAENHGKDKLN